MKIFFALYWNQIRSALSLISNHTKNSFDFLLHRYSNWNEITENKNEIKSIKMKWNQLKWNEINENEMKSIKMKWNQLKWNEIN